MTHFTESTIEETALEWLKDLGCQRIAFGETDKRMKSHPRSAYNLKPHREKAFEKEWKQFWGKG